MTQEQLRMQMLAGIITESQYKEKIQENKIGNIDLNAVKQLQNSPGAKKIAQTLKSDKNLLNKALKFVAATASVNEINEETEDMSATKLRIDALELLGDEMNFKNGEAYLNNKKFDDYSPEELKKLVDDAKQGKEQGKKDFEVKNKMTIKDKVSSILSNAGLGTLIGGVMIAFASPSAAALTAAVLAASLITAALAAVGLGALGTDGYKRKMFEEEELDIKDQVLKIIDLGKQA